MSSWNYIRNKENSCVFVKPGKAYKDCSVDYSKAAFMLQCLFDF